MRTRIPRHSPNRSCVTSPFFVLWLLAPLCIATFAQTTTNSGQRVNQDGLIVGDFQKRISDYLKVRKQAQGEAPTPKQTDAPEKIMQSQHQLSAKIRDLRTDAKQGDIFTPEIANLFRRLINQSLNGEDGRKIRKSYERAEPIHDVKLEVNQPYPDGLPLQSMPPSLLMNLPKLPPELEYRFVGRELVLRDIAANLVVDVIPDVSTSGLPVGKKAQ
jgi:hypothetical protein